LPVIEVSRRAVLAMLAAVTSGCAAAAAPLDSVKKLVGGPSEDPTAPGKMVERHAKRDLDVAAMRAEQDRVLRLERGNAVYGLVHGPEFHGYLHSVVRRLLAKCPRPDVPARAVLVTSRDWAAAATPPGLVFVPVGLVETLENEDQLAFILGHEISHVLFRHHDSDWLVKSQKHAIAAGELGLAARTVLDRRAPKSGALSPTGLAAAKTVLLASDKIIAPAWTRTQEHQADLLGVDIMIASGYNPVGATDVLQKMVAWEQAAGQAYQEPRPDLVKQLSSLAADPGGPGTSPTRPPLPDVGRVFDVLGAEIVSALSDVSQSHPKPEERLQLVQDYLFREYRSLPPVDVSVRGFAAARRHPQTQEVFVHYARAFEARAKLAEGDVRAAEGRAQTSAQGFTRLHSFPHVTLAEIYARANRNDRAMEHLRVALDAPEPALETHLRLAALHERGNRFGEALRVLESSRSRFADHPRAWPDLIRVYRRVGRTQDASALELKCRVEFPDFRQLCSSAAKS
jgi:predicted Zn-dependent protease